MLFSSLCIFWKKFSLILCFNELTLFVDFKSDDRLFHIFGPKWDRHFWPVLLLRNGRFNLNLDLRVTWLWPIGWKVSSA